ncbi:MAG: phage protein Gp36 family protein, partial [Pseudomonadota bacterium]
AIDSAVLQTRLDDATAMINGYIEKRVTLPFDEVPRILVKVCCDLAYYDLLGGQGASLEQAKARYDDSVQFLKAVAKGQASLGDETPEDIESSSPGPAIIEGDDPTFSRDSLKGF